MNDDDLPATRGDVGKLESTLRDELASKDDLRRLESTLRDELASKDDVRTLESTLRGELRDVERRLSTELAQHANAIMEANRSDTRAILEPYVSLPARVDKLEAKPRRRSSR